MSETVGGLELLDNVLSQYDWRQFKSFDGDASELPRAIRRIAVASNEEDAKSAYWQIDNKAILQGRLSSSVLPLTMSLLTALDIGANDARERILDLLATIAGGYDDHVDSNLVGPISVTECVHVMSMRFHKFEMGLYETGYPSYVDILLMCAVYDENLRGAVSHVFRHALTLPSCAKVAGEIETALGELE